MSKKIAVFGEGVKKIVYRGAPAKEKVKTKVQSSWTSDTKLAEKYAKERNGKVIVAEIKPKTGYFGSDPELAKALGIYDQYIKLRVADGDTNALITREARKQKIDVQITGIGEIVVFNPNVIKIKSEKLISKSLKLTKTKPARITPKMPRLR